MLDISTLTIERVVGWFKAVNEEEALAVADSVATGGKLHYHELHLPEEGGAFSLLWWSQAHAT
jgi:hypothetical protein